MDSNITFSTTPGPPKLLPKPEIQNRTLKQLPNTMPSLTPAPGMYQENGRRVRKSTIESRNKCRSKNLAPLLIPAHSIVKKKSEPLRKVKKPRVKCKITKNKTTPKVVAKSNRTLKLEIIPIDQKHKPETPEEPPRKVKKATVVRRKYCKTKKIIPESTTRTKRKYVKSLKYSKKAKALLNANLEKMKNATEFEQPKQLETCKVEENITVENEVDSIKDSQEEIIQELPMQQKLPRIKHMYLNYYQVYNIGFAETSKGIVFKCFSKICNFQTYDQSIFKNHLINFHNNDVSNNSGTFCAFCNEVFTSSSLLQELEHINEKHLESTSNVVGEASESLNVIEEFTSLIEGIVEVPLVAEMTSVQEADIMLKEESKPTVKSPDEFKIVDTKINLKSSDANDYLVDISDDESEELKFPSKIKSSDTTKMQDFSDISSDEEDSIFNESFDINDGSMFDFKGLSSDESVKSYKTVSSNSKRINKILNNPEFCVQRILHDGKRNHTFEENTPTKRNKTEKQKSTKTSQVTKQIPVQAPKQSSVQTQIQLTVKEPVVMNKLNIRALQPWIEKRPNFKYEVSCMKMLEKNALFATYKCMGFTCSYYTSSEHLFYGHLKLHQQNHLCDYPDTYLFCSYCSYTSDKIKDLMNHIKNVHQHDKYQCSHCFYRSCEVQSCSVHMNVYHSKNEQKAVLECEIASEPIDIDGLFEKLIENRLKYVAPLRCKGKLLRMNTVSFI